MPVGGLELFVNRREAQYLEQILTLFALKEIQAGIQLAMKPVNERVGNLYNFMTLNITLKNTMRAVQDKGGGVWLIAPGVEHLIAAMTYCDPSEMSSELQLEHEACSNELMNRIAPQMTLIEKLAGRFETSPLTTHSDKWD